ncbi:MAG: asparagine synthase (glutamine-hydrolyzing) [Gemmatimonadota bacterium]
MCGICGIVTAPDSGRRLLVEQVERMRDVITHRGPDGKGLYEAPGVLLGHRRLAIIDVEHGAQPMHSADGRFTVSYNGEIYNHPDLMPRLQSEGVRYRTHCDTETVLHLYERHGHELPVHLRGMFAIAIWDATRRELFLTRDRFGVKPLYYAHLQDGTLLFGSEIKSILGSGLIQPVFNERTLPDVLANHAPSGDETMFAGIMRLPAGHSLTWSNGGVAIRRYWDLEFSDHAHTDRDDASLVDEYRERFREAVRMRLMSDVPLGMFLSGGIDSAAITAMMASLVNDPIRTFSVAFAERSANELEYARLVARRFSTDHHEIVVTPEQFFAKLPSLVWHEDEPIAHPSSVALNFVSDLASRHVKVVLTGEGSDETLAGYNRYRVTMYNSSLGHRWKSAPSAVRSAVRSGIGALPPAAGVRRKLERTFLWLDPGLDDLYFDNFAVFDRQRIRSLLSPALGMRLGGVDPYAAQHAALARIPDGSLLNRLLYADTKTYLHELLMKQDQMSMAASIESRVPFLDHPLVEFAAALPSRLKLRRTTTKWILREAMKGLLPEEIISRRKMGFPVPVGSWLAGRFRGLVDDVILSPRALARGLFDVDGVRRLVRRHAEGIERHDQRLWLLLNLELWHRIFLDREPIESIRLS